jgi:hypothetical protein
VDDLTNCATDKLRRASGPGLVHFLKELLVTSVIALNANETLLDLAALDVPFNVLLRSDSLRPQWFTLIL